MTNIRSSISFRQLNSKMNELDYASLSKLFKHTYPNQIAKFTPSYFKWRYEHAFSGNYSCIGVYDDEVLIAHAAIFIQDFGKPSKKVKVAQLGDLVVNDSYRTPQIIRAIFKRLRNYLHEQNFEFSFTVPNEKSIGLSTKLLQFKNNLSDYFYLGCNTKLRCKTDCFTSKIDSLTLKNPSFRTLFKTYQKNNKDRRIIWSFEQFVAKCSDPSSQHTLHMNQSGALITCSVRKLGIKFILIKAVISTSDKSEQNRYLDSLLCHAMQHYKTPFYIFWGSNSILKALKQRKLCFRLNRTLNILSSDSDDYTSKFDEIELIDLDIL